jgi:uncharacterized protein YcbX
MTISISSINYCPVKSISFQSVQHCKIKKDIGIMGDRMFAFAKGLNQGEVKLFENSPDERKGKWNNILTLKNSAVLNKYNFVFNNDKLTLFLKNKKLLSVDVNQQDDHQEISNKILELEKSLKPPLTLMKNEIFPFFDTSLSKKIGFTNSISLLNIQSIIDFENKINNKVEPSIFRGNIYIDGIKPWAEREWLGKVITINDVNFKVEKNIPRCVAINLKPQSDDNSFDLLQLLKKTYNHFDMGVFLTALDDGEISIGNSIKL